MICRSSNNICHSLKTLHLDLQLRVAFKKEKKSFKSIKNRLNQIQGYLNGRELITDFQGNSGRAYIKQTVLDPKIASGTEYTAIRFRRLLNQVFEYAVLEQGLQPEYLPYRLDIPFKESNIPSERGKISKIRQYWNDFIVNRLAYHKNLGDTVNTLELPLWKITIPFIEFMIA